MTRRIALCLVSLLFALATVARAGQGLVVHEWGTFTALQNDQGLAMPGINVDDESLPSFVHDVNTRILHEPFSLGVPSKAAPQRHPYVTLRLETPVIYFHLPSDKGSLTLDVDVQLRGGWLTQFYPTADVWFPGISSVKDKSDVLEPLKFGAITPQTVGRLSWKGVTVGGKGEGPQTDSAVWNAPRKVAADNVAGSDGEAEKYLFYRGVGNFAAPLQVVSNYKAGLRQLEFHARFEDVLKSGEKARIGRLWVVEIKQDGRSAYRSLPGFDVTADSKPVLATASGDFAARDFSTANMQRLNDEMHEALMHEGLFSDEASALLDTWRQAYFKSAGLRVFFLVPRAWTDSRLPLKISAPCQVERAMVGRVELVSADQKQLLKQLSAAEIPDNTWIYKIDPQSKAANRFFSGHSDFVQYGDLGVKIPEGFQTYLDLGRFRDALILNEQKQHPSRNLDTFIARYELQFFDPPGDEVTKK